MKKVLVSLVTHSAYKDICDNFLEMFDKNWNDCNYDFCISIIGDKIIFPGRKIVIMEINVHYHKPYIML